MAAAKRNVRQLTMFRLGDSFAALNVPNKENGDSQHQQDVDETTQSV